MINNKISRTLTSLFTCAMTGAMLIPAFAVNADTKIEISEKNFPDKFFRESLKGTYYDSDQDGYLSSEEIKELRDYRCAKCGVKDLTGIEFLTEVECLVLYGNELTTIDLSGNTKLSELWIENNKLTKLDLSKNTELDFLRCGGNPFESLDLSKNTKLKTLSIENSKLKTLDLSKNTDLDVLALSDNKFEKLDLSANSKLTTLELKNNGLTELDLSGFPSLTDLDCSKNAITSLNIAPCSKLKNLRCNDNKLTNIDLSQNPDVQLLFCQGNKIGNVDISAQKNLIMAFSGDKEEKKGYVIYTDNVMWGDFKLAIDNNTSVVTDGITVDDNTKLMYLDQGAVVSLGFEGADSKTQITMTTSDDSVVKIGTNNSLVTRKAGTANITAKAGDKEYNFKVTVYYKDVKDNTKFWFEPTYALTEKGVVKGYDNQASFKPGNKCTRAQMVTFLWRLMGSPNPKTRTCKFSDVKESDYFYKACLWGNEKGIVEGYKDGTFGPQIVCARRHAVTFLWRLAGKPEPAGDKTKFTDVFKDIDEDDYFYKATIWATEQKIVAGYSDNTFRPDGDCLRRQMVTFLYKFDKNVGVK